MSKHIGMTRWSAFTPLRDVGSSVALLYSTGSHIPLWHLSRCFFWVNDALYMDDEGFEAL